MENFTPTDSQTHWMLRPVCWTSQSSSKLGEMKSLSFRPLVSTSPCTVSGFSPSPWEADLWPRPFTFSLGAHHLSVSQTPEALVPPAEPHCQFGLRYTERQRQRESPLKRGRGHEQGRAASAKDGMCCDPEKRQKTRNVQQRTVSRPGVTLLQPLVLTLTSDPRMTH